MLAACAERTFFRLCRGVSEEELAAVVARVDQAEAEGCLERWCQEDAPTAVIPPGEEPEPGTIEGRKHWPELDATMMQLGNGMKVCFLLLCMSAVRRCLYTVWGDAAVPQKTAIIGCSWVRPYAAAGQ